MSTHKSGNDLRPIQCFNCNDHINTCGIPDKVWLAMDKAATQTGLRACPECLGISRNIELLLKVKLENPPEFWPYRLE